MTPREAGLQQDLSHEDVPGPQVKPWRCRGGSAQTLPGLHKARHESQQAWLGLMGQGFKASQGCDGKHSVMSRRAFVLKLVLFGMIFSRTPTSSSASFPVKVAWKHGTGARR